MLFKKELFNHTIKFTADIRIVKVFIPLAKNFQLCFLRPKCLFFYLLCMLLSLKLSKWLTTGETKLSLCKNSKTLQMCHRGETI